MAFLRKAGSILGRTVSVKSTQGSLVFKPSIFQAIRCMSSSRVFVGGLSYSTNEEGLREAFDKYGEVVDARLIVDRETGRSRGFGFVTYSSTEEASAAIQALDQQVLDGRTVKVNYANDRPRGGFGGGGFGGGGGGYGGYGGGGYSGGGGGYGGGGYSGGGGYGGGGNYGDGSGSGSYAAGGESQTGAGSYGNYTSNNSYGSGNSSYGSDGQSFGVAGGFGGSSNYVGADEGSYQDDDTTGNYADKRT